MCIRIISFFLLSLSLAATANQAIEQIVVTATRSDIDRQNLALAWSILDQGEINTANVIHINEIMQQVSGGWVSRGNGQESLVSIRSPVLTGSGACGAYLASWDGIPLRATGFCNVNQLFDVNFEQASSIEVIKGPAPASFGSDAMHGIINVLSAAPSLELDHQVSIERGSYGYTRAKYHYRNRSDSNGLSINSNISQDRGYQNESGYDQQKYTLRWEDYGQIWSTVLAAEVSNLEQETAGYIKGFESYKDHTLRRENPNPEAFRDSWSARAYGRFSRKLSNNKTLHITPYVRSTGMEFLQHYLPWQPREWNRQRSVGIKSSVRFANAHYHWVVGLDGELTSGSLTENQESPFSPNQPKGKHYDYTVGADTTAIFSNVNYKLSKSFALEIGARYEVTNYDYKNHLSDGSACEIYASNCRFSRPADQTDKFADLSINFGASYELNSNRILYFRAARGFRAPQTTELYRLQSGQSKAFIDSEKIKSIELGWRVKSLGPLTLDTTLYSMNKENVIFQDTERYNVSGAETSHYGLELSAKASMKGGLYINAAFTLARHRYESPISMLGVKGNIDGNEIDTAPKYFGSLRIGWRGTKLQGLSNLEGELITLGKYFLDPNNQHHYPGHTLLNIIGQWNLSRNWSARLRIKNILDKDYAERADFGFGQYRYFVGRERSVNFELKYNL